MKSKGMSIRRVLGRTLAFCLSLLVFSALAFGGIGVEPKYIFLDGSRRSVTVNVSNNGDAESEVWVAFKYGYVVSDDTGKPGIVFDSSAGEPSAAAWVKAYPTRFVLGPGETQAVRLVAFPPAGLEQGEYWTRVLVSGKPRREVVGRKDRVTMGINLITQLNIAFHYRNGKVSTGLEIADLNAVETSQGVKVTMKLTRTGNASYWGSRTLRIMNADGKVLRSVTKNTVVYKNFFVSDVLDAEGMPSGQYTLDVEYVTGKRSDYAETRFLHAEPVRRSTSFLIP